MAAFPHSFVQRLALDTALAAGAALRVTRFATTDTLGGWVLVDPLKRWADKRDPRPTAPDGSPASPGSPSSQTYPFGYAAPPEAWRHRLVSALDCPYCVGTQATLAIAAVLAALPTSSPTSSPTPTRRTAGRLARTACAALAASYLVGHVSYRLDSSQAATPAATPAATAATDNLKDAK